MIKKSLDEQISIAIEIEDPDSDAITLTASVKNSGGSEMLASTTLAVTTNGTKTTATFLWTPTTRDTYKISITAADANGLKTLAVPLLILCACQHSGVCDFDNTNGEIEGFAYAGCKCGPGRTGATCTDEFIACERKPCYGSK